MILARSHDVPVDVLSAEVFVVPTDRPESDGTFEWDHTTVVVVHARGGGRAGIGYTYAHRSAAELVERTLAPAVEGTNAMATTQAWVAMQRRVRNVGRRGLAQLAISAVDVALWDLKAKLLDVSLVTLLGPLREAVPVYASGGFTSYDDGELADQLEGWADGGFAMVKMKVGRDPAADHHRVRLARRAIGPDVELFVDANGAYSAKDALAHAESFAAVGVTWFEEPVSSDDLEGLRLVRERAPAGMAIAAGEYGTALDDFRRMLAAGSVDVLMPDGTRCGGVTGLLAVDGLADAFGTPLSTHCAPHLHAHVGCAMRRVRHLEYFHDHARVDRLLFDGAVTPTHGRVVPDVSRAGLGIELRGRDAVRYAA